MNDVKKLVAGLPPERRRLLARMIQTAKPAAPSATTPVEAGTTAAAPAQVIASLRPLTAEKEGARQFYNSVSEQLEHSGFGQFSFFLNYGYVGDGTPEASNIRLPEHCLNRNSVKLVLETIGDFSLTGAEVLDVGCGRGGTVNVLKSFFQTGRIVAMDLSSSAIRFCAAAHRYPDVVFLEGDAEMLPFRDGSFDAVINLESSHLYPDVVLFYRQVFRVLRRGGGFLYADLQPAGLMSRHAALLRQIGFRVDRERDITNNVLLSCDAISQSRVEAYRSDGQSAILEEFLAAPGTQSYETLRQRSWTYTIVTVRKQ